MEFLSVCPASGLTLKLLWHAKTTLVFVCQGRYGQGIGEAIPVKVDTYWYKDDLHHIPTNILGANEACFGHIFLKKMAYQRKMTTPNLE